MDFTMVYMCYEYENRCSRNLNKILYQFLFRNLRVVQISQYITSTFSFHRSFSWAIIIVNSLIYFYARKSGLKLKIIHIVNSLIFFQISSGIIMYYFHFPFSSQPIHLVISTMIISIQFYFLLLYKTSKNAIKI